jgi:hypothetical protein
MIGAYECASVLQQIIKPDYTDDDVFRTMWFCLRDMRTSNELFKAFARELPASSCTAPWLRFYVTRIRESLGKEDTDRALGANFLEEHPELNIPS